ncbi:MULTISPECIES: ATP-grasp domain-containing protein [Arthrobacter]|nr:MULTISPECIES: ATP-grasp domain-containing protein [Arthrobacter]MBT8163221.1 ATP-grasp domain-containing protein [Arthrobacter sp. GN70]
MSMAIWTSGARGAGDTRLEVVASARIARYLGASAFVPVVHTLGLEEPDPRGRAAYWCSGSWAARLVKTGPHAFLSPDPAWLGRLPQEFLGRPLRSGILGDLFRPWHRPLFVSPAQHESQAFGGRVHPDADSLLAHVLGAFPAYSTQELNWLPTIVSGPVAFAQEFRSFLVQGQVTAVSHTRSGHGRAGTTWQAHSRNEGPDTGDARRFAQDVADAMGPEDQAPGYCLDIGRLDSRQWAVVDARPAWSAEPCHCDPDGVVAAILASQMESLDWGWHPDPLTAAAAEPLPLAQTLVA